MKHLLISAILLTAPLHFAQAGGDDGFETGQFWTCVTEIGADAYMTIAAVESAAVSFSYGIRDDDNDTLLLLCDKSEALDYDEMLEFCEPPTFAGSDMHARLLAECAAETAQ